MYYNWAYTHFIRLNKLIIIIILQIFVLVILQTGYFQYFLIESQEI